MKFTTIKTALATAAAFVALSTAPALADDIVRTISAGDGESKPTVITVDSHDTLTVKPNEALDDVLKRRYDRQGKHHWGLSAVEIVDHAQHQAKFNGNIWGVMPNYSVQPFGERFSVGANALFYMGGSGLKKSWDVPATTGPLAGKLSGDAFSNAQYRRMGLGLGPEATYFTSVDFPFIGPLDVGISLAAGIAFDVRDSTKTDERSVPKLNGVVLRDENGKSLAQENTSTRGHSGSPYEYAILAPSVRVGRDYCIGPSVGIMANPGAEGARGMFMGGVNLKYCPRSNSDKK